MLKGIRLGRSPTYEIANARAHAHSHSHTRFDLSQRLIAVITILKYISNTLSIVRVHVLLQQRCHLPKKKKARRNVHFQWLAAAVTTTHSPSLFLVFTPHHHPSNGISQNTYDQLNANQWQTCTYVRMSCSLMRWQKREENHWCKCQMNA